MFTIVSVGSNDAAGKCYLFRRICDYSYKNAQAELCMMAGCGLGATTIDEEDRFEFQPRNVAPLSPAVHCQWLSSQTGMLD